MRMGLFGGSFDPPHRGHFAAAHAAADAFGLDRVLFAPVGRQPLKGGGLCAPFTDRLAMVGLACDADPRFVASELDAPRADGLPNYTVDTLTSLHEAEPGADLFALVGADAFRDLGRWREPTRLMGLAEWIVVTRPGYAMTAFDAGAPGRVHLLESVNVDVSATELRRRLRAGLDCSEWVAGGVLAYVEMRGLYRKD